MGLSKQPQTQFTGLSALLLLLLGFVHSQDASNYYFSSPNTQNRFVPSTYQNSRQPSAAAYINGAGGTRSAVPSYTQPGSYQEQLLFIASDNKQQQQQQQATAGFAPFGTQYSQSRNPDYYDISPRPFGIPASSGLAPSSANSFTRSKAIRPNGGLTQNSFQPQQQQQLQQQSIRSNVPHQQTQFLAHFNEPTSLSSDKSPTANRLTANSFGTSAARPFGNGGFTPSFNSRNRNNFNEQTEVQSQTQQQPPFRNTRNRFQPSSAATTSTTTTSEPPASSSKRYNRFGAGRTPTAAKTSTTTTTTNTPVERPSFNRVTSKNSNQQQRRPLFISREVNEPASPAVVSRKPFSYPGGRFKATSTSTTSTTAAAISESENEDYNSADDEEEDEVQQQAVELEHAQNHVEHDADVKSTNSQKQDASLEKLSLHEASADSKEPDTTGDPSPKEETQTVILTSNFFLPPDSKNTEEAAEEVTQYEEDEEVDAKEGAERTTVPLNGDTTERTPDYEYEYAEEVETTEPTNKQAQATEAPVVETTTTASSAAGKQNEEEEQTVTIVPPTTVAVEQAEVAAQPEQEKEGGAINATASSSSTSTTPAAAAAAAPNKTDEELSGEYEDDEEYDDEEYEDGEEGAEEEEPKLQDQNENTPTATTTSTTPAPEKTPEEKKEDREIISVVTTKSVVNGSTSFPSPVTPRITTLSSEEEAIFDENKPQPAAEQAADELNSSEAPAVTEPTATSELTMPNSTEGYVVIASIQTSRSINGARFLPFPAIEQEETKQTLSELERKIHENKAKKEQKKKEQQTSTEQASEPASEQSDDGSSAPTVAAPVDTTSEAQANTPPIPASTESIIDKLDRVQSELSSGLLSGKYPIISQMTASTPATSTTTGNRFLPNIRKFQPKTTPPPKVKIHHFDEAEMDELAGLLPVGFKPRNSYKNRKITTTTTTTSTEATPAAETQQKKPARNSTISRSFKSGPVPVQDLAAAGLLPKGYRAQSTTTTTTESPTPAVNANLKELFSEVSLDDENLAKLLPKGYKPTTAKPAIAGIDDISKFLPPGYKPPADEPVAIKPIPVDDISKFLPPGYKLNTTAKPKKPVVEPDTIDISKLLPKGYKPRPTKDSQDEDDSPASPLDILKKVEFKEVSNLLPPGYAANSSTTANAKHPASTSTTSTTTTTPATPTTAGNSSAAPAPGGFKVVFPKGIHKRLGAHRLTTPSSHDSGESSTATSVVIKKGPPVRATTEFTGWPTPSTTPISIEKLLERAKTANVNFDDLLAPATSSSTTTTTTSTTTTTTTTPKPTKPGHCTEDCDLAATIKIIDGVSWKPELLDHNTVEWKTLAHEVEAQLNEVYSSAPQLSNWYKKVRIDSFSQGSVLVDYYVELANITEDVNTLEIKKLFHDALTYPAVPMVADMAEIENETDSDDEQVMTAAKEEKLIKEAYQMGKYIIDPAATDFTVIAKPISPNVEFAEEDLLIPQWAIVVIVIGVGSLVFVVIFGVTVLLNRQKRAKAPIPLTNDMLNELKVNHMGGADNYGVDDFYNIDDPWQDTKQPIKPKRFTNSMNDSSGSNIYDSWRSTRQNGDYFYDAQHTYSQKGDSLKRPSTAQHHHQQQQHAHMHAHPQQHHMSHHPYAGGHHTPTYGHQYPDAFADAHPMYTYNNHHGSSSRTRYPRDYDPDF